jgi:hypothetical protein
MIQCLFVFRFWYENSGVFSVDQLSAIKQMTLSSILCAGGDNINRVQKNVFMRVHDNSEYITCNKIPQLNINMWSDCCAGQCLQQDLVFYFQLKLKLEALSEIYKYI